MHSAADRDKKAPESGTDLSKYFGVLKDDPLLDKLEADSKKIRELARSRT
jgi:hypothetical protein